MTFTYKTIGSKPTPVLKDVCLEIKDGQFLGLAGPSGSGKSTLMQHLTGLLKPDKGKILVDGKDIRSEKKHLAEIRRRIGLVFQFPESQLFAETVYEDIAFGLKKSGLSEAEIAERVVNVFKKIDLNFEKFKNCSPFELSTGEQRRIGMAGILVLQPEVLVLDEPTAGLDFHGEESVVRILKDFHKRGKGVLLISHNLDLLASLVNRIEKFTVLNFQADVFQNGMVQYDGDKRDLFKNEEAVNSLGLTLPRIQKIARLLKKKGLLNSGQFHSIEDIKSELAIRVNESVTHEKPAKESCL